MATQYNGVRDMSLRHAMEVDTQLESSTLPTIMPTPAPRFGPAVNIITAAPALPQPSRPTFTSPTAAASQALHGVSPAGVHPQALHQDQSATLRTPSRLRKTETKEQLERKNMAAITALTSVCQTLVKQRRAHWHLHLSGEQRALLQSLVREIGTRCISKAEDEPGQAWKVAMAREAALSLHIREGVKKAHARRASRHTRHEPENINPATGENRCLDVDVNIDKDLHDRVERMVDRFERYNPEVNILESRPGFMPPSCVPHENDNAFLEWCRIRLFRIRLFAYYVFTQNVSKLTLWFNMTDDQVRTMRDDLLLGTRTHGGPIDTKNMHFHWITGEDGRLRVKAVRPSATNTNGSEGVGRPDTGQHRMNITHSFR